MSDAAALRLVLPAFILLTHVVVPASFLLWLGLTRAKNRWYLLGVTGVVIPGVLAMLIAGPGWGWVSYHLRWAWAVGLVAAGIGAARRWTKIPWRPEQGRVAPWVAIAVVGVLALVFVADLGVDVLSVSTACGYFGEATALTFPLRGGRFVIGNGGASEATNGHYAVRAQRYALDISALNAWGTRASGLYPADVNEYEVYGAEVIAPCSGAVAIVVDGLPDRPPGDMDPANLAGNHVILHCGDDSILLAHLAPGTVVVSAGDHARAGQPIGRVGNTGNTSEPHLHIHAVRGAWTDVARIAGDAEPRPMLFEGRFLIRHDTVDR